MSFDTFMERLFNDVHDITVGLKERILNARVSNSIIECKLAFHRFIHHKRDEERIQYYFSDCSSADQHKLIQWVDSKISRTHKEIDTLNQDIKNGKSSCYGMFSKRESKKDRLLEYQKLVGKMEGVRNHLASSMDCKLNHHPK